MKTTISVSNAGEKSSAKSGKQLVGSQQINQMSAGGLHEGGRVNLAVVHQWDLYRMHSANSLGDLLRQVASSVGGVEDLIIKY